MKKELIITFLCIVSFLVASFLSSTVFVAGTLSVKPEVATGIGDKLASLKSMKFSVPQIGVPGNSNPNQAPVIPSPTTSYVADPYVPVIQPTTPPDNVNPINPTTPPYVQPTSGNTVPRPTTPPQPTSTPVRTVSVQELAQCLSDKRFTMYGIPTCPACAQQKQLFGSSFSTVPYVDCTAQRSTCSAQSIRYYPTWKDSSGQETVGAMPLQEIARLSGCPSPS